MAQRRMFSPKIVSSDAFLDMPASSRELYFQLGMYADDDGFVNPRFVVRMCGASEDDLKLLVAKRFALPFDNGVIVIKHWKVNNLIKNDRYTPTIYQDQKNLLFVKQNGIYTDRNPDGTILVPQVRLGKVRLGKVIKQARQGRAGKKIVEHNPLGAEVIKSLEKVDPKNKGYYGNKTQRSACDFLIREYGLDEILKRIVVLPRTNKVPYFPTITTPVQLRDKWVQLQDAVDRKRGELKEKTKVAFS